MIKEMETNQGETNFEFSYSAKRQKEVDEIRKKYLPKEEDKLETLKRLDSEAERPGTIASIVAGTFGTLLLGVGMCCTMVWAEGFFLIGVLVGLIGIAVLGAAYPLYKKVTKKEREKIADQILALSAELSA